MTHKDMFKSTTYDSLDKQVNGDHYKKMKIQPAEFINENGLSLLKVEIQTGRTHQIRVHLNSIGHPIYGDKVYSKKYKSVSSRMLLHSYRLRFKHPIKNKFIDIKDDIPKEFTMEFNNIEKVL